jgi:peptide/nickel transport system substrate-binding protein
MIQKHFILIAAGIFLFVFIASRDNAQNTSESAHMTDNILRIDLSAPINSLDPNDQDQGATMISPLIYSFLCVPDATGELKPDLAVSWTYDPEKFAWTILLRDNAVFHDNRPVKASDVKHSFLIAHRKSEEALVDLIHDISTVSGTRLCIYLKKDDPDFINKIWTLGILPEGDDDPARKNHT